MNDNNIMDDYLDHIKEYFSLFIFDFDGTLVEIETDWNALKYKLSEYCKKELQFYDTFSNLDKSLFKIRSHYGENTFRKLLEIVSFYELQGFKDKKITNVINFLISLSQEKIKTIFSSNCRNTVDSILKSLNLDINLVVAKEDVIIPKPSGQGIIKILEYFNMNPNRALFIGNSDNDIKAGNDARVKTILWKELFL